MAFKINLGNNKVQQQDERTPEKYWGNVGVYGTAVDEDGNEVQQFISLNYGIPLSSVKEERVSGSENWQHIARAKNSLYEQIMQIAMELEPGETFDLDMVFQIRSIKEKEDIAPEDQAIKFDLGLKKK